MAEERGLRVKISDRRTATRAGDAAREAQVRAFRRSQAMGLLILAGAIVVFWLFRTNPRWIFPPGWWRL